MADPEQIEGCRNKLNSTQPAFDRMVNLYSLISNEARLKIACLLHQQKELCPCDISDIFEMTIPAVSQHLKKLKNGRLINSRREKQTIYYRLLEEGATLLKPILRQLKCEANTIMG